MTTDSPRLACAAGHTFEIANHLRGCPSCLGDGTARALEVEYDDDAIRRAWSAGAGTQRGLSLYERTGSLPHGGATISLGEGLTPLVRGADRLRGSFSGDLWFKLEGYGPTGSYKDRMNAVAVAMACTLGAPGVVCSSTGNQGVAMAAFAAAASLPAVVLLPKEAPEQAAKQAAMHGATVLAVPWDVRPQVIDHLVGQRGWSLSNRNDPRPWGNPFGLEGYRAIAHELIRSLGRPPKAVIVPTCGGDGFYGIWKGFRELHAAGVIDYPPRMIAAQPAVSDSLVRAVERDEDHVSPIPLEYSIALSLSDRKSSDLALRAVKESSGTAVRVTESAIEEAMQDLSSAGIFVEPASAAALAALSVVRNEDLPEVVCILTASGVRWPSSSRNASYSRAESLDEALQAIDAQSTDVPA